MAIPGGGAGSSPGTCGAACSLAGAWVPARETVSSGLSPAWESLCPASYGVRMEFLKNSLEERLHGTSISLY